MLDDMASLPVCTTWKNFIMEMTLIWIW